MEGMGEYIWPDGRRYEGEYKDDKKHGYGIYTWADNRIYQGWWFRGKQHGLGLYFVPGQEMKYGLWEDGKRIEWFDKSQAELIQAGEIDYREKFRKPESGEYVLDEASFHRPYNFDERYEQVNRRFSQQ